MKIGKGGLMIDLEGMGLFAAFFAAFEIFCRLVSLRLISFIGAVQLIAVIVCSAFIACWVLFIRIL